MEHQPFAEWRAIRTWAIQEYEIGQGDFELLLELHKRKYFTTEDFFNGSLLLNWDKHRWRRMVNDGWVQVYRKRVGGANHRYNIYELSRRVKTMITRVMSIVSGLEPIPVTIFDKKTGYSNKRLKKYIKKHNHGR